MSSQIFNKLSFLFLFLVVILLPFFFLPFTNIPVEISKGLLLVAGLALCVISWAIARFFDGEIVLPRSLCLLGGVGVVVAFFLSALFSGNSEVSFFGTMFDVGSFWFIFAGFLLMVMSSIIFKDAKNAKLVLFGAVLSSAIVLIFQGLHLLAPQALSLGVLGDKTANLIGAWNAFGIFAGLSALLSLLVVEFFPTTRIEKLILQVLTILSMLLVAVVNFAFVWSLLGIFALIIFVYKLSVTSHVEDEEGKRHFPIFSFVIIMIALLFFVSGQFIGGILPNRLGLSNTEISPSFGATMSVTKSVLKEDPVFGLGPNRFSTAWSMYKPLEINSTPFWDVTFNSGLGLLPTFISTTGILGILAWVLFFFTFMWSGVRSIFSSVKHGTNWETMAFFVLSFYLFVSAFFYSVGSVILLLALVFAGIFLGLSASNRERGQVHLSFLNDHRKSFFSIFFLVLVIIVSAGITFKYMERFVSVSYFRQSLTASTIPLAENSINRALGLHVNDLYLRTYAQIYLLKLGSLVAKEDPSEEDKALLQATMDQAINGAGLAAQYDPTNYLNFQTLGAVYQNLGALGVKDSYSKAVEAYKASSTLNPNNPGIKLAMASASFALDLKQEAKDYANAALALKPDYIDAFLVLSQIAKSEGDNAGANSYAQKALALDPLNKDLAKYVDSLKNSNSAEVAPPLNTSSTETKNTEKAQ